MAEIQTTISPVNGAPICVRTLPTTPEIDAVLAASREAYASWRFTALKDRLAIINKFLSLFESEGPALAAELTLSMGRPKKYVMGEIGGFLERAKWLCGAAEKELGDLQVGEKEGFKRWIRREPVGVCMLISAWNFPYMIQSNALIPALLAGNTVILKPSPQTPVTSEHISRLLNEAGLPPSVCQTLHLTPTQMDYVVASPLVNWISFTGSVVNGLRVDKVAREGQGKSLKTVLLELGGKDPAYVREDAEVAWSAAEIADGGFFNSGQSCCAIERVYVHEKVYDEFVEELVKVVKGYVLADPTLVTTTLGPVISAHSANAIRTQISEAVAAGAKALIPEEPFKEWAKEGSTYVAPQVLVDVDHSMKVMREETFGPVVGVMKVKSDEEALKLMNDSDLGLTASIWTKSEDAFNAMSPMVEAGTVFLNRCDYLDPALGWTGVKMSGRGVSLSTMGFASVTQAKSMHLRLR